VGPYIPDPSSYRSVTAYQPIQGLHPQRPSTSVWDFHPSAGVAQSFDSNVEQTSSNHIADTFTSLSLGAHLQVGTPDSIYIEGYDTILALNAQYLFWADLFALNPHFDALNQRLQMQGRIGRSSAIWRPYITASDVTGSNLLTNEQEGRVRRQRLNTGFQGDYKLTSDITWSQNFSFSALNHPNDGEYINSEVWRSYQELNYRTFHDFSFFIWDDYRSTLVDQGSNGQEFINGFGWRGKPDPRLFSELLVGWDNMSLDNFVPGRRNMSGVRLNGHTSFDWGPRLRLTLKYDRGYTFNELQVNDNYVNNTVQIIPEIFLGENWYLTPYFGISYNQFESSNANTLEIRPELEVSYMLPNTSRVYAKIGYDHTTTLNGPPVPIVIYRCSLGVNWTF
jgi:hypothetical protein